MTRNHRQVHRWIWLGMAVVLGLILLVMVKTHQGDAFSPSVSITK